MNRQGARAISVRPAAAFSLLEVMVVVLVLGILAAVVVPRFDNVTNDARTSALQGALGGVRSGLASHRTRAVIAGDPAFPTLGELTTPGTVVEGTFPANPFNELSTVQAVSQGDAESRVVRNESSYGWNYFVDNEASPPVAIFYANSSDATTGSDGGADTANEM